MSVSLRPHPNQAAAPAITVEAHATRPSGNRLELHYVVTGDLGSLYLPPAGHPVRADELWKRTCFEAFVRPGADEAYFEFNFAPTRWWAAYRFDRYRQGMADADIAPARIEAHTAGERFELAVAMDAPSWPADRPWRLGLTAVIEALNGEKSYWALAHAPEKPDFHHPDSFALDLFPAEPA
ncbi:MAG TPA: DOMON-like domain-containing protein [Caulobacteraceae bacterium]